MMFGYTPFINGAIAGAVGARIVLVITVITIKFVEVSWHDAGEVGTRQRQKENILLAIGMLSREAIT